MKSIGLWFCLLLVNFGTAGAKDLQVFYGAQPLPQESLKVAKFSWSGLETQVLQRQGSPYLEPSNRLLFTSNQPSFTLVGAFSRLSLHPLAQGKYYLDYLRGPAEELALEGGTGSLASLSSVYFVLDGKAQEGRVSISDFSGPIWSEYDGSLDFQLNRQSPGVVRLQSLKELKCGRHLLLVDGQAFTFHVGRCDFYTYAIKHKQEVLTGMARQMEAEAPNWKGRELDPARRVKKDQNFGPPYANRANGNFQASKPSNLGERANPKAADTTDYPQPQPMDRSVGARLGRQAKNSNLMHPKESLLEGKLFDDGAIAKRHADEIMDTEHPTLPPEERERIKEEIASQTRKDMTLTGTEGEYRIWTTLRWIDLLGAVPYLKNRLFK
ncbi:MAG: hypothetical protein A2600_01825 [Candidatus Lambdaproteobacteria bacterium RIFOXYD1_FULL_56_27]|uniref:FecR protein domain-containing protein n=1 Tax=Candidatus Lambdaproteobacteria bacterium RIFOXYD2_FULL_56_26 TaxID=1817773 RepID=A0A1F6GMS4_9PROT|nr:MAG: hypothetical protein A2557_12605 [Candidatus Lambdaproteobacteria bacterium RIFOXYD2_FULL_56_26]OGH05583.1 MAG: hypothetical protein A2426_04615 [Candidatus Lambdaproteobacteria bacterium RIFOXYC1_FULL_56_13]OGH08542.1 MAG: hypothetical protein A2600_01825 [Candidatus Lambdaproteobacteria bacterium RIFOXYD1_FULL_56_27]